MLHGACLLLQPEPAAGCACCVCVHLICSMLVQDMLCQFGMYAFVDALGSVALLSLPLPSTLSMLQHIMSPKGLLRLKRVPCQQHRTGCI